MMFLVKSVESVVYHLKAGLNFTVQTLPTDDKGKEIDGKFVMRRALVLKVTLLSIRQGHC